MPARPWGSTGLGWILALVVLILAIISLVVTVTVPNLTTWLIVGLALALLV